MNPLAVAAKGKGPANLLRRARSIGARYGVGPRRMEERLSLMLDVVGATGGGATLPVTAAAAKRNPRVISRFAELGFEFAVHGYHHVDHTALSPETQAEQIGQARRLLEANGVPAVGFRAPYLRWNEGTLGALREHGFLYDSSQAFSWPVDGDLDAEAYQRALSFYGALSATEHPVLPRLEGGIVQIPCCLPDDEAVVERLKMTSPDRIAELWLAVQRETYERGELFTMQVHPERIQVCARGIAAVVQAARAASPSVWIARLEEIARWWVAREAATVVVRDSGAGRLRIDVRGPEGLVVLARRIDVPGREPWGYGYERIGSSGFDVPSEPRPFIAVHPSSPSSLSAFLREQGYIVESASSGGAHSHFISRDRFSRADERPLLDELDRLRSPLLRIALWPDGARSALAITGDVDALTIWDYGLRFLGR